MLEIIDKDNKNYTENLTVRKGLNYLLSECLEQYRFFTRYILALSIGILSLIISIQHNEQMSLNLRVFSSLVLLSFVFGLALQFLILYRVNYDANQLIKKYKDSKEDLSISSNSTKLELICFFLQMFLFALSFLSYLDYR